MHLSAFLHVFLNVSKDVSKEVSKMHILSQEKIFKKNLPKKFRERGPRFPPLHHYVGLATVL